METLCFGLAVLLMAAAVHSDPGGRVLARKHLTVVETRRGGKWLLLARRDGSPTPELVLEEQPAGGLRQTRSARVTRFLGREDLLDVEVSYLTQLGINPTGYTRHYLVRVGPAGDERVCSFEGDAGTTSARVRVVAASPLTFDVELTPKVDPNHAGPEVPLPVRRYVLPDHGPCRVRVLRPASRRRKR